MTHQLPSFSPLTLGGLLRATFRVTVRGDSARTAFEGDLCRRFEALRAVAVGSGTQALQLAILIAQRATASRVVGLPAYTCYDVASAAIGAGSKVAFYDLDPTSLIPESNTFREVVSREARTLVVAYAFGFPIDWHWVRRTCGDEAVLIEDLAQGIGSSWAATEAGRHGDLAVLSFGRGKGWTGGGGGALLVRSPRLVSAFDEIVPSLERPARAQNARALALAAAQWLLGRPTLYGIPKRVSALRLGETVFKPPRAPERAPALCCGIAAQHAEAALRESSVRREVATRWSEALARGGTDCIVACSPLGGGTCGYLRYPIRIRCATSVDAVVQALGERGLARGYPLPLFELPALREHIAHSSADMPGARELARELVTVPTHSRVRPLEPDRTVEQLRATLAALQ